MIKKHFRVITNNPLVKEELSNKEDICYFEATYEDILLEVRACIYDGYKLLSHPLSGSVKPGETPYKSVLISTKKETVDIQSARIIEQALETRRKFVDRTKGLKESVLSDFQMVDMTLLESALESANRL
jgi:hypothetical protein